jgi:phage terminase Nu1 subunit (DNA packaging protein)
MPSKRQTREVSQSEFAELVGLTTRQIRNLEREGLPHRADQNRKTYPVPAAVLWWHERGVKKALEQIQIQPIDEARTRKLQLEAERAEIELAKERGRMIDVDDVDRLYQKALSTIRARLLALPGQIAAQLPLEAIESLEIIEPLVHAMMAELSEARA